MAGETAVSKDDNFSADPASVEAFGRSVKEAVAEKDLEALADLAAYPLYIGFVDGGVSVESREEMIVLGEEKIFTQEWMERLQFPVLTIKQNIWKVKSRGCRRIFTGTPFVFEQE